MPAVRKFGEPLAGQPQRLSHKIQRGKIVQFLRRNLFSVELSDGQTITAAMPSELLHVAANHRHGLRRQFISVSVRLRQAPRMNRIVSARPDGLT
jgi:hypothetical protein